MDAPFLLLQLCFFVSGFAALLYETAWTRELASVFGTSELAVSAVLAAYMGGLALGAALIARWAPRVRRPVLAYGLLELGIAAGALWVPFAIRLLSGLYVEWLGGLDTPPAQLGLVTALFHLGGTFLVLLPCTTLMGATLPLLARYAVRHDDEIGPRIGLLYGVNTGGAILGALAAAFLLLPSLGLRQTIYFGAAANTLVFLAAAGLSRLSRPTPPGSAPPAAEGGSPFTARSAILPLIALSGMVSFIYEVLWVRILGYVLGGSTAAFASMLSSFLLGIALGSAAASRLARTPRQAAMGFAIAQLGTAFFASLSFGLANWIPEIARELGAGISNLAPGALISVVVLLPTTLCIGATFPFAVRIFAREASDAAPASARVYAWNTLGSIVGSIGAGFFLLPLLGFDGTLAVGVGVNLVLAASSALLLDRGKVARAIAGVAVVAGIAFLFLRPGPPLALLGRSALTGTSFGGELEYLGVGRSATVTLSRTPYSRRLATNGLPEASMEGPGAPRDKFHDSRWLGLLPVLARPDAARVLIIGLGGGNTLGAIPQSVENIELIELEPEVVIANRIVGADRLDGAPLDDPRLNLRIGDARGALMLSDRRYDAIISQPSHPWTSGASHLYTREFFSMVSQRLEPDGVFVQWMGLGFLDAELLRSLVGTLGDVFEHLLVISPGTVIGSASMAFVASNAPLPLLETTSGALVVAKEELARIGVHTVEDVAVTLVLDNDAAREFSAGAKRISDDHNSLAWAASRVGGNWSRKEPIQDAIRPYDVLPDQVTSYESDLVVRRLFQRRARKRAQSFAESLQGAARASARGWAALESGRPQAAYKQFSNALEADPGHQGAITGIALVNPAALPEVPLEPRLTAFIDGRSLQKIGDWEGIEKIDQELAAWPPGSLLYPEATRLRIAWRLTKHQPDRAAEAFALADVLVARSPNLGDLLLRTDAAAQSGLNDHAWASLDRLRMRMGAGNQSPAIAQRALKLAAQLEPFDGAQTTLRGLRTHASPRRKRN